jgi:hypothetical protein
MEYRIRERWRELCEQIAVEQDVEKFSVLFDEVCLLLEQREAELMAEQKTPPAPKSRADIIAS